MKIKPNHKYLDARLASLPQLLTMAILSAGLSIAAQPVAAQSSGSSGDQMDHSMHKGMDMGAMLRADSHAPAGITGAELMMKDRWMVSYSFMRMEMEGNLDGTSSISPEEIVTTVPNIFFGTPGQPPTLRVVPTEMTTDMHMLGIMYAPTDKITVMGMLPYLERSMKHTTFQGGAGTTELGTFTTRSSGIGDVKINGLFAVYDDGMHRVHVNAGLSLPTGSIDEKDTVLAPNGLRPELRLPYPMQLGSGTYDLIPGVTYKGRNRDLGWGAQYMATLRTGENDEDYTLGDIHQLSGWASYSWTPGASASLRLSACSTDEIDGQDPNIVAPVQTANPDFQGGDRIDLGIGINLSAQEGDWRGLRFNAELGIPLEQDLNGPQMEADWNLTAVVRYML
jgi:hypothetical protein